MTFKPLFDQAVQDNLTQRIINEGPANTNQLKNQPKEVAYCKKCVISNQRPRITFDKEGVCSPCHFAERKKNEIDWKSREKELVDLLDRHRSSDGSYDVIVPGSGGKDSSSVAYKLKHKYGMHPLTVTWAPFIYTDIGFENFYSFIHSGFDNITCWPNGINHRKLARLSFDLLGDPFQPFVYGQVNYPFQIATKFNIKLVFYGENGEAEYGGSTKSNDKPCFSWDDFAEVYMMGSKIDNLMDRGIELGVFSEEEKNEISAFYRLPSIEELKAKDIAFHWFSYYQRWIPQENYYFAHEHTNLKANPEGRSEGTYSKYASLDDKTDGFHYYLAFLKFGIGRATSDAAHEIRDGHINREEALALVKRYDGEFPKRHFQEFLSYLDISEENFRRVIDSYRAPHLWTKENDTWKLNHAVWHERFAV